jgi:hypothetical protein
VALLLAKYATTSNRRVCLVDFDFIGSGIVDLFAMDQRPDCYLEGYFLDANPREFKLENLLGRYSDEDMGAQSFSVIFNLGEELPETAGAETLAALKSNMMGLIRNEPHYREIQTMTEILFEKLNANGIALTIVDCHPGLGLVSETVRSMADTNVYVTTPNRSDCFSLLKAVNLKGLDGPGAILILNMAEPSVTDLPSFRYILENDGLVGTEAKFLFPYLKTVGRQEAHFAVIPASESLRRILYIGGSGYLPKVLPKEAEFSFCKKVLALI